MGGFAETPGSFSCIRCLEASFLVPQTASGGVWFFMLKLPVSGGQDLTVTSYHISIQLHEVPVLILWLPFLLGLSL